MFEISQGSPLWNVPYNANWILFESLIQQGKQSKIRQGSTIGLFLYIIIFWGIIYLFTEYSWQT